MTRRTGRRSNERRDRQADPLASPRRLRDHAGCDRDDEPPVVPGGPAQLGMHATALNAAVGSMMKTRMFVAMLHPPLNHRLSKDGRALRLGRTLKTLRSRKHAPPTDLLRSARVCVVGGMAEANCSARS